jgi:hypothetical protein
LQLALTFLAILVELHVKDFALVEEIVFVLLLAMMEMLAPLILVILELEEMDVSMLPEAVAMEMLAPTISAIPSLDVHTPTSLATHQTNVLWSLAILP